jgi:hypothetical protein
MVKFVFWRILFIFGILIDHDLSMHILYQFHGWLIFVRVITLFMFVWPYVRPHIYKHEKGYNSRKNQPSVKSVKFVYAQIIANQDTKYE